MLVESKMDIEGAENAIAEDAKTMAYLRPRLAIAMERLPDDPIAIPALMNGTGLDYATVCGVCVSDLPQSGWRGAPSADP
jgi:hypothetical protein